MRVLAIDTALDACAVCVLDAVASRVEAFETLAMPRGHAEALPVLLERVVAALPEGADAFATLRRVAVTVGPGSFTGLRVGLSCARALGLGLGIPVVGVSTLAALAGPLVALRGQGLIAAAIDARRGAIYLQVFAPAGRTLAGPLRLTLAEAAAALMTGELGQERPGHDRFEGSRNGEAGRRRSDLVGEVEAALDEAPPARPPLRLVGTGAPALGRELRSLGCQELQMEGAHAPDARWVARLGALADPARAQARPLYLKGADAAPQDAARIARA